MNIGVLWRGERGAEPSERATTVLGPLFDAFHQLGVASERIVYADDALDEVRQQLHRVDGVLVWVNPIQDGANRAQLDSLLREVSARGVWVSAHPDVILQMGTKEVLFRTRAVGWGTDTDLYRSPEEMAERLPRRLAQSGPLVVKQARGNGGDGVWRVELVRATATDTLVRIQHALTRDAASEETTLQAFLDRCGAYFAWSGSVIIQPFQPRLPDGMIRCYFVHDRVAGFCHQWPTGLLATPAQGSPRGPWEDADAPHYQRLKTSAESDWIPAMKDILGLRTESLPAIWDADFLYGPKDASGHDTYVLCEINISCVWPFPPRATTDIARAAIARVREARAAAAHA
jgi:hypothetical protein